MKNKKLLVVDVMYLPSDIVDKSDKEIRNYLEDEYNCFVILIDSSKLNTCGNNTPPIYFA